MTVVGYRWLNTDTMNVADHLVRMCGGEREAELWLLEAVRDKLQRLGLLDTPAGHATCTRYNLTAAIEDERRLHQQRRNTNQGH